MSRHANDRPDPIREEELRQGIRPEMDTEELVGLVAEYFCKGYSPTRIAQLIDELHQVSMSREMPYKYLTYAATRNWLRFVPPAEDILTAKLRRAAPWLSGVSVVHAAMTESVADRTADVLVDALRGREPADSSVGLVVGFAGGHTMSMVAQKLGQRLSEPDMEGFPHKVTCLALVNGFDVNEFSTDPNCFLSSVVGNRSVRPQTRFVGLRAPSIVELPTQRDEMLGLPGIAKVHKYLELLDVIVTSAGSMDDRHSMLSTYYSGFAPEAEACLKEELGCVGDMLWLPMRKRQPLRFDELSPEQIKRIQYRAMTLVELDTLANLIQGPRRTEVLLTLGPCPLCRENKWKILGAILGQDRQIITRIIVDSRSAEAYLNSPAMVDRRPPKHQAN